MTKATDTFKNNPIIKEYMEAAQHNQDVMNGSADIKGDIPPMPQDAPPMNEPMPQQ